MKSDDLISRQTAIDLWDKYHPYIATKAMAYDKELRALPSAQPERIQCKDCRYSEGDVFDRGLFCTHGPTWFDVDDDHCCSWGKRRTNVCE